MPRQPFPPSPTPAASPEVHRLRALVDDLRTENEHLLESQRVLEGSRDDFFDRFEMSPLPSLILDDRGGIRSANRGAILLLGPAKGGLIGRLFTNSSWRLIGRPSVRI